MFGLPVHILLPTLFGSIIAGILCSAVGTLVVRLKLSSLGFAMSHAAFAGAALGIMLALPQPSWLALVFSIAVALILGPIARIARLEVDTIIGATFPFSMALGLTFLSKAPSAGIGNGGLSLLWGSVLGISYPQVMLLFLVLVGVLLVVWLFGKEFLAVLLDKKLAIASGIPADAISTLVLFMVAVVVAAALRITGGLLIYALMILPASAAFQWVYDIKKVLWLAPILGCASALVGLALSLAADLPVGSSIALAAAGFFFLSTWASPKRRSA